MYAEAQKIFEKYKKVDFEKQYYNFVYAVFDNLLDPNWTCCSKVLPQRQNTRGSLSTFFI